MYHTTAFHQPAALWMLAQVYVVSVIVVGRYYSSVAGGAQSTHSRSAAGLPRARRHGVWYDGYTAVQEQTLVHEVELCNGFAHHGAS